MRERGGGFVTAAEGCASLVLYYSWHMSNQALGLFCPAVVLLCFYKPRGEKEREYSNPFFAFFPLLVFDFFFVLFVFSFFFQGTEEERKGNDWQARFW